MVGDAVPFRDGNSDALTRAQQYSCNEKALLDAVRERLRRAAVEGTHSVLWGMATKGVLFANLCDPERQLISACVDKNEAKHDSFIAGSGRRIRAPSVLPELADQNIDIYVVNPNYAREIREECEAMGLDAEFLEPGGEVIFPSRS